MINPDRYEAFIQKLLKKPLPSTPMERLRVLAKELAQGAAESVWDIYIMIKPSEELDSVTGRRVTTYIPDTIFADYFLRRWKDDYPNLMLLRQNGYVNDRFLFTKAAYDLVNEAEPANIFISYSHQESSPFALLILRSLNQIGLSPFLDMAIPGGDDWDKRIQLEIDQRDYFIAVLGQNTLSSEAVRKEITWAAMRGKQIIPVWHNGFSEKSPPSDLDADIFNLLNSKQAIKVLEQSGSGYYNAIVNLLNRFGVTP